MTLADIVGYVAGALVFTTFYMRTMYTLRIVGICSNIAFISYGALGHVVPVLVLHSVLLPLNIVRFRQMLTLSSRLRTAARGDLDPELLRPFAVPRRLDGGQALFCRGDAAHSAFFIVSGRFRLNEIDKEYGAGHFVGEIGMLAPHGSRSYGITCADGGELLEISYEHVRQLYYQSPKFAFFFLHVATRRLFESLERAEAEVAMISAASRRDETSSPVA